MLGHDDFARLRFQHVKLLSPGVRKTRGAAVLSALRAFFLVIRDVDIIVGTADPDDRNVVRSCGRIGIPNDFFKPRLVQAVYPSRVPAGDLGLLCCGTVRQDLLQDLLTPWEGGLHMGVVIAKNSIRLFGSRMIPPGEASVRLPHTSSPVLPV